MTRNRLPPYKVTAGVFGTYLLPRFIKNGLVEACFAPLSEAFPFCIRNVPRGMTTENSESGFLLRMSLFIKPSFIIEFMHHELFT